MLRQWRQRRRRSQLDLALDTGISARHLSFVETGRSRPGRGLLIALAEQLDVPLRERNALMLAAGYAPTYAESDLLDDYHEPATAELLLTLQLAHAVGDLRLHSTVTSFGSPHDVTLSELTVESFFPADAATRELLQQLSEPDRN
ncbi:MAG: helix-turn-helix domain-containing protein [Mycobacterium sp.]